MNKGVNKLRGSKPIPTVEATGEFACQQCGSKYLSKWSHVRKGIKFCGGYTCKETK